MKLNMRAQVIDLLGKLASEEYQRNEWSTNLKDTWFFPDEILCEWFDDLLAGTKGYWVDNHIFTPREIPALDSVSNALRVFQEHYDAKENIVPMDLLEYPYWVNVISCAKVAYDTLR